jgi:ATP-dependent DNA helicase RecG
MQSNPGVTIAELSEQVGISDRAIEKQISKLNEQNLIRRIGPAKGGHWEVVE